MVKFDWKRNTFTVSELIAKLEKFDGRLPVVCFWEGCYVPIEEEGVVAGNVNNISCDAVIIHADDYY